VRDGVAADFEVATVKLITLAAVKSCESDCLVIVSVETWAHMTHADLQKVRSHLAAIEALLAKTHGGAADDESLLEFRRLCWAALLLAHDGECHEQIDLLVQYAKDLYSERDHDRADVRDKIRTVLSAFRTRLNGLERGYGKRWRDLRAA
jgi:hypothetical protein